jgi:hypothetical protein
MTITIDFLSLGFGVAIGCAVWSVVFLLIIRQGSL